MKIKSLALPILILFCSLSSFGQNGSSAYNFLNITSSSKIYGLGGVNISLIDDDISIVDQNPALLGSEMSGQVALNYMHYIGGSNFAGARYGHSAGEHGAWSAALQYFGYGSIKETDVTGNIIGSLSPQDLSFSGMYSHDINEYLRGGITMKVLYSSYAEFSALALATDLGINYYNSDRDQSFSLTLSNLGGQVKRFNESYDRLPFDVRLGWSQVFGSLPIRFSVTAWNLTKWHLPYYDVGQSVSDNKQLQDKFVSNLFRHLVFGADLVSSQNWHLGIGYNYKTRTDMSNYNRSFVSGFSLTGGLSIKSFRLGVAFSQPHTGATTVMVNLGLNLSEILN